MFSVMTGQHQRIVEWLTTLSFVDSKRIGFYGLSYGGKTAMRIPVLVKGYALSICSGDFNECVRKVASTHENNFVSYPYTKNTRFRNGIWGTLLTMPKWLPSLHLARLWLKEVIPMA
jgi:hypothetical protein